FRLGSGLDGIDPSLSFLRVGTIHFFFQAEDGIRDFHVTGVQTCALPISGGIHALSHVTGGGIAANLARVLPQGSWAEVDRSTWSPGTVFRVLADMAGTPLVDTEGTWNLGIGFLAVVADDRKDAAIAAIEAQGIPAWQVATVRTGALPAGGFEEGAKGVDGGAVRLVGAYANGTK